MYCRLRKNVKFHHDDYYLLDLGVGSKIEAQIRPGSGNDDIFIIWIWVG